MSKMKQILLKREYGGYILGAIVTFIAIELIEPYRALSICVLTFGGFHLIRKWFN